MWTALPALLLGCGSPSETLPVSRPPTPVAVVQAESAPETMERSLTGVLAARRDATLSARVGGTVLERIAEPGARVEEGQPILRLDGREASANLAVARAQLADSEALLTDAERRLERSETLGDGLSVQDLDAARTAVARALAARDGAAARRDLASVQLGHHVVRAPFAGEVASLGPEVGETVAPGAPVARVVDTSGLVVTVGLLDDEVSRAESFTVLDGTRDVPASLRHVAAAAEPRTLTWPVELDVPVTGSLRPGRTAQVRVSLSGGAGVVIPMSAIGPDGDVWTVVDGAARAEQVEILGERGGTAVVAGIAAGVDVVLRGTDLTDGQPVTVVR